MNYLLEFFVADLFGCRPFETLAQKNPIPFFSVYRKTDCNTPSCFGGPVHPYRRRDRDLPGLHYINEKGKWTSCPWHKDHHDAGIVIVVNDHRHHSMTLALCGFSGRATESLAQQLILKEEVFWPPRVELKGKEVGIYLCKLSYSLPGGRTLEKHSIETCDIVALNERTLKRLLQ